MIYPNCLRFDLFVAQDYVNYYIILVIFYMLYRKNKFFFICLVTGLLTTLFWVLLAINPNYLLEFFTYQFYDSQLRNYPIDPHFEKVLIVNIDEASLKAFGQWPWPRLYFAEMHRKLLACNPKVVIYPWVMSDPDRSSPALLMKTLQLESKIPDVLTDYDQLFAKAIEGSQTVLGCLLLTKENERGKDLALIPEAHPLSISEAYYAKDRVFKMVDLKGKNHLTPMESKEPTKNLKLRHHFAAILPPLDLFSQQATIGFSNLLRDSDGKIRRVCLIHCQGEHLITHLTLRGVLVDQQVEEVILFKDLKENFISINNLDHGIDFPVSKDGTIFIHFHHRHYCYPEISAVDLLKGNFDPKLIENKIVVIGTSSSQLQDFANTPIERDVSLLEINATIIDNLFNHSYITTPAVLYQRQLYMILGLGILITLAGSFFPLMTVFLVIFLSIAVLILSSYLFSIGLFFNPVFIIGAMISVIICLFVVHSLLESEKRKILRDAFSRYLSPSMVAQIEESGFNVFAGQRKEVTLMFADIRDFTTLSENLYPEQIVNLLNRYFTPMTACVKQHAGTVDKLIGDALMAFWNAPLEIVDHAQKAVETALDMQKKLNQVNQQLMTEFKIKLRVGIGIHTGEVYVGNMGSGDFLDYTCIGDNVNLTSRVENLCKYYDFPILITLDTARRCQLKHFVFRTLDEIQVKGKNKPTVIQAVLTNQEWEKRQKEFVRIDHAVLLYKQGEFEQAIVAFKKIKLEFPSAVSCCDLYISRCKKLLLINREEWDGIWKFKNK